MPLARGTVARIGQVLLNLLANALEALPRDSRAGNRLLIALRPSSTGGIVMEVSDNGAGIPPEYHTRVFDPFFTTKAPGSGTGLGLAISQRLVTEMGGQLSFDSDVKRGTTFRMILLAADLEVARNRQASASA